MGKVWVLDTETKGTGARMVPLEETERKRAPEQRRPPRAPTPEPKPAQGAPAPRAPRRFRVTDVMTRKVLADGAGTRATVDLLRDVRSVVDVSIDVWDEGAGAWAPLTMREKKMLWELRSRLSG